MFKYAEHLRFLDRAGLVIWSQWTESQLLRPGILSGNWPYGRGTAREKRKMKNEVSFYVL